jgi:glyoxylase-like metal-dependent hydrolase (beta-lactamase superfamily II)
MPYFYRLWAGARSPGRPARLGRLGRTEPSNRQELAAVLITGFPSDATATNCWVVAPGDGEQCVVIDPGVGVRARLDEVIAEHRLHPVAVLLTHGHVDHTFSVLPVCQARDVPAYIHPADRGQLADPWSGIGIPVGTPLFGNLTFAEPDDVKALGDGEKIPLAGLEFEVRHAPGHSAGSVVFGLAGAEAPVLFAGDVLFAGSIGRVDLPGGSMVDMENSLRTVILPLDDATDVRPGHGPSTTIARERATNPFLQGLR